ncbi:CaiB/BaiF CoA transferase family protein [Marinimicrobium koreense]|uniref:CaiB/BaiF CoA transferase family protein n=1 Tax=Marinimicrobium koreense TaxID=306545 RepID=UPI003F72C0D1
MSYNPEHSSPNGEPSNGPLSGIKVLDLSAYIAGPYGCTLLADQGAEVLKIEPPSGDNLRRYPSTLEEESRAFIGINRNKRGMVLDLKSREGHSILMELVKSSDVLVHNFRPGVPERLGIDYETVSLINPKLIYCSLTGYGETGPMRYKAGYDQVLQTMSGMCSMQGEREGVPEIVCGSVVDYYAAALIASGTASALFERERSGLGQYVGVSLLRSAITMQSARFVWAESEPSDVERDFRSGGVTGIYKTKEGYLYLSANTPHFWSALCHKTNLSDLSTNTRYDSIRKRARYADEIVPLLRDSLESKTAFEWESIFGDEVPCAAVREIEDVFKEEQVFAEEMISTFDHPIVGKYRGMTRAIKYGRTPGAKPFPSPVFGQHSDLVLKQLGFSESERKKLYDDGIVK